MDITPVNGHILIKPLEHKTFLPTDKGMYEEVGIILKLPEVSKELEPYMDLEIGDKVYFDSWLASKYPTGNGDEKFWLVPYKDVRAIEKQNGNTVSE